MRGVAYVGSGLVEGIDLPAIAPHDTEVRVRPAYVGLCGTDLHIVHGNMDARVTRPLAFGHEASVVVEEVGQGVTDWAPGDKAVVMPLDWDGTCAACLAGNEHICQSLNFIGIDSPGALQESWTVPSRTLIRLPENLDLRTAALAEPLAVALHDVRRGEVKHGDRVVILGGGPIGGLISVVSAQHGAHVLVAEPQPARRALLEALGVETVDPTSVDLEQTVTEWSNGAGADVVFEVSGAAAAVLSATALARVRGTIVVVAIHPDPRPVNLQRVFWRELRILGARVYTRADFEGAVDLLASGAVNVEPFITAVVPLERTADAIDQLNGGTAVKILVAIDAEGEA